MAGAWYRGWREVRRRWRGVVASCVLVGVVGGVTLAAVAGARRTASSYDRFRADTNADDAFLQATGIDERRVQQLLALPQVATWSRGSFFIGNAGTEHDFGIVASHDGRFGSELSRARVLAGRAPDPEASDEVAVNENTAEELGRSVGDTIRFRSLSQDQLLDIEEGFSGRYEGPELHLRVVGLFRAPDDLQGRDEITAVATPAFERRYRDAAGHFDGFYAIDLRGHADADDVAAFETAAAEILPRGEEWGIESAAVAAQPVHDALRVLTIGLLLFAACAGVAGAVAAGQALGRQLSVGGEEQPTLAALGMSHRTRAFGLIVPGLVVAAGGALVAVVVAVAASPLFPIGLARQAEPDPGVDVDLTVLALGALAFAVLVGVRVAASAWAASRVAPDGTPAERPSAAAGLAARAGVGPVALTGVRMAFEPGRGRARVPVRPALVGAVAGIVGLVGAVTFATSLDRLVGTPERWGWNWDLAPDALEGDIERFAADPDVGDVGEVEISFVEVEGEGVPAFAMRSHQGAPSLAVADGRPPAGPDEAVLGADLLERLGRDVGDTVELAPSFGGEGEPLTYRVVGQGLFPSFEDHAVADGAGLTPEGLDRARQTDGSRRTVLTFRPGVDEAAATRRLTEAYPEKLVVYAHPSPPGDVVNLAQVDALPWVLAAFLVVVALTAVAHALVVSVRRRRGELAILRALGLRRGQVRTAVAWQASSLVVIGLVAGIPLGLVLGRWAWALVAREVGVLDDAATPIVALLVLPLAAVVVANLTAAVPAQRAASLSPAAVLRSE